MPNTLAADHLIWKYICNPTDQHTENLKKMLANQKDLASSTASTSFHPNNNAYSKRFTTFVEAIFITPADNIISSISNFKQNSDSAEFFVAEFFIALFAVSLLAILYLMLPVCIVIASFDILRIALDTPGIVTLGMNPIIYALKCQNEDVFDMLIKENPDPKILKIYLNKIINQYNKKSITKEVSSNSDIELEKNIHFTVNQKSYEFAKKIQEKLDQRFHELDQRLNEQGQKLLEEVYLFTKQFAQMCCHEHYPLPTTPVTHLKTAATEIVPTASTIPDNQSPKQASSSAIILYAGARDPQLPRKQQDLKTTTEFRGILPSDIIYSSPFRKNPGPISIKPQTPAKERTATREMRK